MIYLKVPKDRVAVIIGANGETRKWLEEKAGFPVHVDSKQNEVVLHGESEGTDPVMVLKAQDVVRAIARGFSPQRAERLFADDTYFELLDIHDYVGKDKHHVRRVAARIIGTEGKTRRIIEEQTGCEIAVYGHTVGIIADVEALADAKQAVDMILRGAEHASVYRFLERRRREARRAGDLWG